MAKHTADRSDIAGFGPGLLLLLAASRWRASADVSLRDAGVSGIQSMILVAAQVLHAESGAANQVNIARFIGLDVMTMSKNVRSLEKNGLVERGVSSKDSRARTVELTKLGSARLKKLVKGLEGVDEKAFDEIGGMQKLRKSLTAYVEGSR
ncbi:MAG: MarR family winged helix-turn-helix transcriptional regulator [Candidatus Kapabacteria bacterium]|nr:MarR family winged helix-turn-helix transcriptional regulator [Candidatus Kapabacteria bacterium]